MDPNYTCIKNSENNCTVRILISMHPNDRYTFLEPLIRGIFKYIDAAVYYSPFPSDDSVPDMDEIDLMIVGVTEKYITWHNSGFVSEAMPAIKKQIPILPIMLEAHISNLFNTRVGKLHYIENTADVISEENLIQICEHINNISKEHYPSSDNAPSIFISYRKQDAPELQRLVQLLNAHPERNNISLWYDTELNPGDNYKQTIIDRLKSCSLFLMLVTPNILEPNNYVMRDEYPLALKEKKRIVPIVMQKTDLNKLYELFPELPKCITSTQTDAIFSKIKTDAAD